ncbi:MAG TPA: anaerobic ribonucleoside-triphosphate reductase activating protein [Lachnospiraceae bacterium]|nr:anaerobic ribonucleoside-triphosphate reductase activating protein [Lachnospiraceae bacterium]
MQIHGFNKTTLLDYPKHLAATIFLGSCNYRCPFCHNSSLVLNPHILPSISEKEVLDILAKRRDILEGVCITGGEPTLQKDLPDLIHAIKQLGLKVKLDTNGSNPAVVEKLLESNQIDYIAMDIKNSIQKYAQTIGVPNYDLAPIFSTIQLIQTSGIDYEFRTTIVQEFHEQADMIAIGEWLNGSRNYYLQSFLDSGDILSPGLHAYDRRELIFFKDCLVPYFKNVELRGID